LEWEWVGMGMGMTQWKWEGNGNKKVIPRTPLIGEVGVSDVATKVT